MAATGKKKKPPTFQYLPKSRAKRLKKAWVEDHKIRSKWKAQKRRDGLTNQTTAPVEDGHANGKTDVDVEPVIPSTRPDRAPMPTPSHDKRSLRDIRRIAYASKHHSTQTADSRPKEAHGHSHSDRSGQATRGQPNMKLRMNVLLETIKRDFSW